jgi:hypothetical protein
MTATLSRLSLLAFFAVMLCASEGYAGKSLPIKGAYGDESGCRFRKHGSLDSDSFTYVSKDRINRYESGCSFLEITDIKGELSRSGIVNAWSVNMVCEAEGDANPEDVVIVESKNLDEQMSLELRYKNEEENQTLYPCK